MEQGKSKRLYLGLALVCLALIITRLLSGAFDSAERSVTAVQYRLRGESRFDSSIVILYLSGDDIASLGGIPLKRSYYALILDILRKSGARAVGVDIAFTEPDRDHPEYDDILSSVVRNSGNVVLGGYFRSVNGTDSGGTRLPDAFIYRPPQITHFPTGSRPELPFRQLLGSAAGFGHTTMAGPSEIPLFFTTAEGLVPGFPFEVLRVALGAPRSGVKIFDASATIETPAQAVEFPVSNEGNVALNFPGGTGSLNLISTVDFLKSYDESQSGGTPDVPADRIRGKIVLLGIIAEGRSSFVTTPFSSQFPSIGLHATMIHDALHGTFLRKIPQAVSYLLALAAGCVCIVFLGSKRQLLGILGIITLLLVLMLASFAAFSSASIILPVIPTIFTSLTVAAGLVLYGHHQVQGQVYSLQEEKERIHKTLSDKESRLKTLEQELSALHQRHGDQRSAALLEEIRTYKTEILRLRAQADDLQPHTGEGEPGEQPRDFGGLIYQEAGPMQEIVTFIRKISGNDASVLVLGESGTGKELVARAIHQHSPRVNNPFVAVNCGALSETLLESELFGHERGAFTGAVREKPGRFELADGGTIFLDEIAETSEAFQVKLLRVLQDGTLERVGGTQTMKVNVRVIAATNRDLRQAVGEKQFRDDLYYRLNVFAVHLPPLRKRAGDIPLLARHFIGLESPGMECSAIVMEVLRSHPWRGNVRELQSVLKRAVLLAKADGRQMLRMKDLPGEIAATSSAVVDIEEQIMSSLRSKHFSRNAISETGEELGGFNRGTVAEYLRGYCFKKFVEAQWNIPATVEAVAASADPDVRRRVERKLMEYIGNAIDAVDRSLPPGQVLAAAKPKYKNLPQRYHPYLDELVTSYRRGDWNIGAPVSGKIQSPDRMVGDDPA